jgi:flagellar basal-body rod protein FlgB
MQIFSLEAQTIERYLDLSSQQIKNTAVNMANIDTPGFKTIGFDFNQAMDRAINSYLGGSETREEQSTEEAADSEVDGLISRPDGNNVSLDREGMKMADGQLKFRTGVALLRQEITEISDAIHSDSK